jgi:prepilin signal peptidase PulO-like enzyme (type II secretory pathway)
MSTLIQLALFVAGLAFGSFLNVVTLRYSPERGFYRKEHFSGRSHCPHCHKILSWYELIPLASYMIQRGRCRTCQSRLTVQYPLVELTSGLIFLFVPLTLKGLFLMPVPNYSSLLIIASIIWIVAMLFLLATFIIDLRHYIIPNSVSLTLFIVALIWIVIGWKTGVFGEVYGASFLKQYAVIFPSFSSVILNHLIGAAAGALFFFIITLISSGKAMGMGDVKLIGALGLLFGWPDVAVIIPLSFILGAVIAAGLLAFGKKTMTDKIPFGPFIVLAAAIVMFFGTGLMSAYFGIIGM